MILKKLGTFLPRKAFKIVTLKIWSLEMKVLTFSLLLIFALNFKVKAQQTIWELLPKIQNNNLNSITSLFDSNKLFAVGDSATILSSNDLGITWQKLPEFTLPNIDFKKIIFVSPSDGFILGTGAKILKTEDAGYSWFEINNFLGQIIYDIQFVTEDIGFVIEQQNLYKTIDGGINWFPFSALPSSLSHKFHFKNDSTAFQLIGAWLERTFDYGLNWNSIFFQQVNFSIEYQDIFFRNNNGYVITSGVKVKNIVGWLELFLVGKIQKTIDGGNNWSEIHYDDAFGIDKIYFLNDNIGYIICRQWNSFQYPDSTISYFKKTLNGGYTWDLNSIPTNKRMNNFHFINQDIGFAVGNDGTIIRTLNGGVVSISEETNSEIPQLPNTIQLLENYPNPFNPSTTINYELKNTNYELAKLSIFNVLGQKVREWILPSNSGKNSVIWDGTDNFGKSVSSGVYLYRLKIGNESQTKKMLLLK
ncbi:MAG: T9SS C-terminal target domain-containing protein [Calditrichaeota bacterium]|nr:MAG: T9SS C-terminal target domain-containing protein [Calditrichota bacterium]